MFQVGDKIVHPMHGAGIVESIDQKKVNGEMRDYYVLKLPVRAMVVGIPNVGKSTFINKVARKKSAKASDRPGVTRGKQWVTVDRGLELRDTPGILWPKFEDVETGMRLAFTGAVKDEIMDVEPLGCHLMAFLGAR